MTQQKTLNIVTYRGQDYGNPFEALGNGALYSVGVAEYPRDWGTLQHNRNLLKALQGMEYAIGVGSMPLFVATSGGYVPLELLCLILPAGAYHLVGYNSAEGKTLIDCDILAPVEPNNVQPYLQTAKNAIDLAHPIGEGSFTFAVVGAGLKIWTPEEFSKLNLA